MINIKRLAIAQSRELFLCQKPNFEGAIGIEPVHLAEFSLSSLGKMEPKPQEQQHQTLGISSFIALLAIIGIACHLLFRFFMPLLAYFPLYLVLAVGGSLLVLDLLRKVISLEFGSDLLAGMSIITSVLLEQYLAGSLVVLMLSGGEALENFALRRASKVLEALAKRAPTFAHKKNQDKMTDIPVEEIAIGDIIHIFPHEICPVDGEVIEGHGVMDESFLTGEPFQIDKAPGSSVLSGSINGDSSLIIKAGKLVSDSRYAKIMQVMLETEQKRPRMRRLADQLGAWYTPLAVLIALLAWMHSGESIRFLAVLVIATPCPLLIAIPVAIIGSISLCASRGILVKNPIVLEQLDQCQTMIFDKTGTLTYGKPVLVEQKTFSSSDSKEVLRLAASLEQYSKHPLATAILDKAEKESLALVEAKEIKETRGKSLQGLIGKHEVLITSRKQLDQIGLGSQKELLPEGHGLECIIVIDGKLDSYYRFHDAPRYDSVKFVSHLLPKHKIKKVMIVSGDREEEVRYLANTIGVSGFMQKKARRRKSILSSKKLLRIKRST